MTADRASVPGGALPNEPTPQRRSRPGRHLRPVDAPSRRRSPAVPVLVGTGMVLVALFALAVMHALLIGGQLELDETQRAMASEAEEVRRLHLRVAELESPDRVLEVARDRLGMVPAAEVGYLLPAGIPVGDGTPVRVDAAERPPADEVPVVGTVSPDRPVQDGATTEDPDADDSQADDSQAGDSQADDSDGEGTAAAAGDGVVPTGGFEAIEGGPEEGSE